MAESVLVNRKKFISSLDNKLVEPLNALSKRPVFQNLGFWMRQLKIF